MSGQNDAGDEKPGGMRENLDRIQEKNKRLDAAKKAGEPEVGIFWSLDAKLILDGVPLREAEDYGQFKNYPGSHQQMWRTYQRVNAVPCDREYDEPPRGRVLFDTVPGRFYLYADACILRNEAMLSQIQKDLHLPPHVRIGPDEHYRCAKCLGRPG